MTPIENAFSIIDRKNFVPESQVHEAYMDRPLPIGFGQSISQPTTVKRMLNWLDPKSNQKILDIGSGSGWTTALLSEIVKPDGRVFAVEIIPELLRFGEENCRKIGVLNAEFHLAGKKYGLPEFAPFDRILVSASANEFPTEIINQLNIGGKLVIPVKDDILEITKTSVNNYRTFTHPGYIFVPLINNE